MGQSTISMAIFNSFLYVYQAGYVEIIGSFELPTIPSYLPLPRQVRQVAELEN